MGATVACVGMGLLGSALAENLIRAGFTGKIAIHPDQVDLINQGYMPDDEEVRHANAVVDAFERAGGAGAVQLEGKMLDKPHLTQALRVLAMAGASRG